MTKLANWTMRAGNGTEVIHGWVIQTNFRGQEQRQWIEGCSQQTAFSIAKRREALDWCRAYTLTTDGQRVVLA